MFVRRCYVLWNPSLPLDGLGCGFFCSVDITIHLPCMLEGTLEVLEVVIFR